MGQVIDDVLVRLRPGVHRLTSPVIIDSIAWASAGRQLRIQGERADNTIVSGSVIVKAAPVTDPDRAERRLPRGVVRIALNEIGIVQIAALAETRFGKPGRPDFELFSGGRRLTRSRWPKSGYATVQSVGNQDELRVTLVGRETGSYATEPALMIGGYLLPRLG